MHKLIKFALLAFGVILFSSPDLYGQSRRLERAERAFELQQYHEAIDLYRRVIDRLDRGEREKSAELSFKVACATGIQIITGWRSPGSEGLYGLITPIR